MFRTKLLVVGLLFAALTAMGCSQDSDTTPAPSDQGAANGGGQNVTHAHGTGPNGGVVFDLGKYHAEFTVDHPANECTVLVLGDDETTPLPIAATELTLSTKETATAEGKAVPPMTVTLVPQDAADGKASKFVGTDPGIGNVADFEGTVLGEIDGRPSQGEFKE